MNLPEKLKKYPFITWGLAIATVVLLLYVFKDIFGADWLAGQVERVLGSAKTQGD